jgi:hypothetical protein
MLVVSAMARPARELAEAHNPPRAALALQREGEMFDRSRPQRMAKDGDITVLDHPEFSVGQLFAAGETRLRS